VSGALDTILAKVMRLNGAPVLFAAHGRHCGPGPGVLLVHRAEADSWELPSLDDVVDDPSLEAAEPFGDCLLAHCDTQFEPKPEQCWVHADFALTCTVTSPRAVEAIKKYLADSGEPLQQQGAGFMESSVSPRDAQLKAQRVYQAFGDAEGAPGQLNGESETDYRIRLLSKFQKHSKSYKDANLSKVAIADMSVFNTIEDLIYADAVSAAHDPANFKPGVLIPQRITDSAGRVMTKYIGDDGACWNQFNPPIRHIRKFNVSGSALH
jgi:hypothetical protein